MGGKQILGGRKKVTQNCSPLKVYSHASYTDKMLHTVSNCFLTFLHYSQQSTFFPREQWPTKGNHKKKKRQPSFPSHAHPTSRKNLPLTQLRSSERTKVEGVERKMMLLTLKKPRTKSETAPRNSQLAKNFSLDLIIIYWLTYKELYQLFPL